jgi:hypothetical protein
MAPLHGPQLADNRNGYAASERIPARSTVVRDRWYQHCRPARDTNWLVNGINLNDNVQNRLLSSRRLTRGEYKIDNSTFRQYGRNAGAIVNLLRAPYQ